MGRGNDIIPWAGEARGKSYDFTYERGQGIHILTVNDVEYTFKAGFMKSYNTEAKFKFDGIDARFVVIRKEPDVVVDGVHLKSGKPYIAMPKWAWVFVVLCLAIPFVSFGGILSIIIGIAGVALCKICARNTLPTAVRVLLCLLATIVTYIVAWGIWYTTLWAIQALLLPRTNLAR
jgi:hypothetical protein